MICLLAPLFKMLEATLELIVPLVMATLIDKGIAEKNNNFIILLCVQLVVLGLIGFTFSITAQYFSAKASISIVKKIKSAAYEKSQRISTKDFEKIGQSTIITRLTSDMDGVQNGINLTLRLLLRSPFVVFGACIMAYHVDHNSIKIFSLIVLLLSIIIFGIMFITIPMYKSSRNKLDKVLLSTRESITGSRVIRAFNKQDDIIKEFNTINNDFTNIQVKTGRINALLNPLTMVVINIGIAVLVYSGAIRVNSGIITTGIVVALYNYMSQILVELVKFANLIVSITKSIACGGRIAEFLDIPDEVPAECNNLKSDKLIEFRNVNFAYNENVDNSLDDVSFVINKGEKIGIIGSTGSGKTTLLSLLLGYYKPTTGTILLEGKDITTMNSIDVRNKISIAEQNATLFKGTVRSNLIMADSGASDDMIKSALSLAQADFVYDKNKGLDAEVEQKGRNFSGGQRQRISIARALLKDADILMLDDAYSALDYSTEAKIRSEINKLDKTVITVSQRTGSIINCDKIILLENGKAEIGTHKELLANSKIYRDIHFSQFEEEAKEYD